MMAPQQIQQSLAPSQLQALIHQKQQALLLHQVFAQLTYIHVRVVVFDKHDLHNTAKFVNWLLYLFIYYLHIHIIIMIVVNLA